MEDKFVWEKYAMMGSWEEEPGRKNEKEEISKRRRSLERTQNRRTTLVIEGNAVYELDEECMKEKNKKI